MKIRLPAYLHPSPSPSCGRTVAGISGRILHSLLRCRFLLLAASFAAILAPAPARAQCGPAAGGATTCGDGPATQGNQSGTSQGAGNPINVISGNKYQREDDLPALPGVLGLEVVRHYNSAYSTASNSTGILGHGWKLSYETDLYAVGNTIQIMQADGTRIIFNRDPDNRSLCSTANPANGSLRITRGSRGDIYTWTWTSGRTLRFDSNGKLEQIAEPTGEFLSLQHDAKGMLVQVNDPQGRQLLLQYPRSQDAKAGFRGVARIISPAGTFRYAYGSSLPKEATEASMLANLIRVTYPADGGSRVYHHEDAQRPTYLTGISVTDAKTTQRISSYGYNQDGKAVLSVRGPANTSIGKVTLDFSAPGITVMTNSLDQKTTYRHAIIGGEQRLLEVRGAGCHQCGEMNVRYGYDQLGRLIETTRLTTGGIPIQTIRLDVDYYGRPLTVNKIIYQDGKAGPARQQTRYVYSPGTAATPSLIAQPSVVPGKEFITRVTYNASDQPLEITQSGWAPANGDKASPTQLSRTSKYVYQRVNGRTLLAAVDGPLPNGASNQPVDSDVTLLRWDAKGNVLVGLTTPGNFTSAFTYDAAGRMANVSNAQGRITEFTYDARNRTVGIMRDGITQSTRYDTLDNAVETGYLEAGSYKALGLSGYDTAGRQVWSATSLGILQTRTFDTENKVLVSSTQAGSMQKRQRYQYDDAGRLVVLTDGSGSTRRINWNTHNLPEQVTDALGREQHYRYDGAGNLLEIVSAANVVQPRGQSSAIAFEHDDQGRVIAVTAPNGATTRTLRDDFGNILSISSADSGKITRSYDAGGRLVTSMDANGNHAVYEYDVAGRIVKQTVFDTTTPDTRTKQTVTSWKYNGKHLVAIDHPHQTEQFQYDARDQRVAKTVSIVLANGGRATSTTRYQYDVHGQLTATSLPDGSTLIYRRNSQNQIVALERSRTQTSWLRWLLPARTFVAKIERDLIGLRHYVYGNGIEARHERSREGVLARIVYRRTGENAPSGQKVTGLDVLMGVTTAHAGQHEESPPAQAISGNSVPARLPGALGLPVDKQALVDHRYLWDVQGNLLHARGQDQKTNYAYDAQDRLIVTGSTTAATGAANPSNPGDARYARYFYDGTGNRLLSQEDISSQADTSTNTVKAAYGPASSRWQGSTTASPEIGYDPAGQPERIGAATYTWNAMGQLGAIRQNQRLLATYTYDHRGERIAKSVDGKHTYYLYENRHLTAELDDHGRITRQYIYLGDQPIAVIDTPDGTPIESEERAPLLQIGADLAAALRDWINGNETVAYLHNNHLGATELATDQQGLPVWRARYGAFGNIMPVTSVGHSGTATTKKGFVLNLRLPGQYEDAESGLYFNDHRYYDPKRGAYLTPDPLGLRGGINSYAYVKGNPLKYVDPSGLVLFAFDGTDNTDDENWLALHNSTVSNVVQFRNIYANDNIRYITGVGTVDKSNPLRPIGAPPLDSGFNFSGPARIDRMMEYFNTESDLAVDSATMEVDIIGFSRGAAEARDFSNRIVSGTTMIAGTNTGWYRYTEPKNGINVAKCQKVDFRFMGLWDTVLSTSITGYVYQLAIPAQFFQVSQAVALNEYRGHVLPFGRANVTDPNSFGAFPLESIKTHAGAPTDPTRVEQGFIGSHADIGGGFPNNDLSQVALAWMVEQATKAGIQVTKDAFTVSANPVLHDKSDAIRFGSPVAGTQTSNDAAWNSLYDIPATAGAGSGVEDRDVHYRSGSGSSSTTQRQMTGTGMTNSDTEQFITYDPVRSRTDNINGNITGTINMDGYRAWLLLNGYDLSKLTIQ